MRGVAYPDGAAAPETQTMTHPKRGELLGRLGHLLAWVSLICPVVIGAMPSTGWAQSSQEQYMRQQIRAAQTHYEMLELREAEKVLEAAISSAESADESVSKSLLAKAWVMLGVVRYGARREANEAKAAFVKALRADRGASIPEVYVTPRLMSIWRDASEKVESGRFSEIEHAPVTRAPAGQPLRLEAVWNGERRAGSAAVLLRLGDQRDWIEFEMAPTERDVWVLSIPGRFISGDSVEYVVEFRGTEGARLGRTTSTDDPHRVTVRGVEAPAGQSGRGGYVDLMVGTGVTYLTDDVPPTANPDRAVNPGLASSIFHAWLEGGWRISERAHLGLYLRYQMVPTQDFAAIRQRSSDVELSGFADDACFGLLPGDCLLGVRNRLFFGRSNAPLRGFSSVSFGVGRLRDLIRIRESASSQFCQGREIRGNPGSRYCYRTDTVRPGWLHLGIGGGIRWQFSDHVGLVAESTVMVLFPDPGVHLDVNVGPHFEF
jgi:hypothetical protein